VESQHEWPGGSDADALRAAIERLTDLLRVRLDRVWTTEEEAIIAFALLELEDAARLWRHRLVAGASPSNGSKSSH